MNNITLTELEKQVLEGINNSEYADGLGEKIWQGTERCRISGTTQIRGVYSSLVKKGLVEVDNVKSSEATVWLTELGIAACKEYNLLGKYSHEYATKPIVEPTTEPKTTEPRKTFRLPCICELDYINKMRKIIDIQTDDMDNRVWPHRVTIVSTKLLNSDMTELPRVGHIEIYVEGEEMTIKSEVSAVYEIIG